MRRAGVAGVALAAAILTWQQGVLARIEWHGGEEQTWALREITPGMVRAAAYRHRRGWHDAGKMGAHRHGPVRQHAMHRAMYRQR